MTVADRADVEAVLCDDQLPFRIDARQRARHPAQPMDADLPAPEVSLEQPSLKDIEPPGGVGRRVIGRSLAQMATLVAKNGSRDPLHHRTKPARTNR